MDYAVFDCSVAKLDDAPFATSLPSTTAVAHAAALCADGVPLPQIAVIAADAAHRDALRAAFRAAFSAHSDKARRAGQPQILTRDELALHLIVRHPFPVGLPQRVRPVLDPIVARARRRHEILRRTDGLRERDPATLREIGRVLADLGVAGEPAELAESLATSLDLLADAGLRSAEIMSYAADMNAAWYSLPRTIRAPIPAPKGLDLALIDDYRGRLEALRPGLSFEGARHLIDPTIASLSDARADLLRTHAPYASPLCLRPPTRSPHPAKATVTRWIRELTSLSKAPRRRALGLLRRGLAALVYDQAKRRVRAGRIDLIDARILARQLLRERPDLVAAEFPHILLCDGDGGVSSGTGDSAGDSAGFGGGAAGIPADVSAPAGPGQFCFLQSRIASQSVENRPAADLEAEDIADLVRHLHAGVWRELGEVPLRDIGIVVTDDAAARRVRAQLDANGTPSLSLGIGRGFGAPEITGLLRVLRAVATPTDAAVTEAGQPRERIAAWHRRLTMEPPGTVIERVVADLGCESRALLDPDPHVYPRLRAVLAATRDYFAAHGGTLDEYLSWAHEQRSPDGFADIGPGATPPAMRTLAATDPDANAVWLLDATAARAAGLPVLIAGGLTEGVGKRKSLTCVDPRTGVWGLRLPDGLATPAFTPEVSLADDPGPAVLHAVTESAGRLAIVPVPWRVTQAVRGNQRAARTPTTRGGAFWAELYAAHAADWTSRGMLLPPIRKHTPLAPPRPALHPDAEAVRRRRTRLLPFASPAYPMPLAQGVLELPASPAYPMPPAQGVLKLPAPPAYPALDSVAPSASPELSASKSPDLTAQPEPPEPPALSALSAESASPEHGHLTLAELDPHGSTAHLLYSLLPIGWELEAKITPLLGDPLPHAHPHLARAVRHGISLLSDDPALTPGAVAARLAHPPNDPKGGALGASLEQILRALSDVRDIREARGAFRCWHNLAVSRSVTLPLSAGMAEGGGPRTVIVSGTVDCLYQREDGTYALLAFPIPRDREGEGTVLRQLALARLTGLPVTRVCVLFVHRDGVERRMMFVDERGWEERRQATPRRRRR